MDEVMETIQQMLGAAYRQGMAAQRMENAQADFNHEVEHVGEGIVKIKQILNITDQPEKVQ